MTWVSQVFEAIGKDGLATVEVVFFGVLIVAILRSIRGGVCAAWAWFTPLGADLLRKVGEWFDEMTATQRENTSALNSHALAAQAQAAATSELSVKVSAADRTKTIDAMAGQVSEIHQNVVVLAGRDTATKG